MNIVFTLCSNNYLAQAKTLGESVLRYNPDCKFIIVLCDKLSDKVNYSEFKDIEIIECEKLGVKNFDNMSKVYNIIEFNTSVKPFAFEYMYKEYDADSVIYLDPDICVFNSLEPVLDKLKECNAILTPHILNPVPVDDLFPQENLFTNYGLYNLGFFATKRSEETFKILKWWRKWLIVNCKINLKEGIFVDQLPMNFTPIFFNGITVDKTLGLNVAPWNLHERELSFKNGKYFVNDEPLIFYHFSSYDFKNPEKITKYYTRAEAARTDVVTKMYNDYRKKVLANNWAELCKIPCCYGKKPEEKKGKEKGKKKSFLRKIF